MGDLTSILWSLGTRKVIAPLVFLIAGLIIWEVLVRLFPMSRAVIVPPSAIYATFKGSFWLLMTHAFSTLSEIVMGFAVSVVVGMTLGAVIVMSKWTRQAFYPNIVFFQLIPKAAVAPLFILWLGFGSSSRIAFAVFMSFFPIAIATATGLENTRLDSVRLCRSLTASQWQIFTLVRFPFALPHIFAGLKVGMTLSMIGVIVGEFISAQQGLGYVIMFASSAGRIGAAIRGAAAAGGARPGAVFVCRIGRACGAALVWGALHRRRLCLTGVYDEGFTGAGSLPRPHQTLSSNSPLISIGMPCGSSARPTAERAC